MLDYQPSLADSVVAGDMALDAAYKRADQIRRSKDADKIRERELRKRETRRRPPGRAPGGEP